MSYLLHCWPYDEAFRTKTELFTEYCMVLLCIILQTFNGDLFDPEFQYKIAWLGFLIIGTYIVWHLSYTGIMGVKDCIAKSKGKCNRCKKKEEVQVFDSGAHEEGSDLKRF